MTRDTRQTYYCSFCGKSQREVKKLIAGPTAFICDECVEFCQDIMVPKAEVKELLNQGARKMLDIPMSHDVFQEVIQHVSLPKESCFWDENKPSARQLLNRAIYKFACIILRERQVVDNKILEFQQKRQEIT